ncbi:MAG: acyl carrier protein [Gemmatimonadetes bacterium]|nr:acyl carrier protein [Gemmatimonadota bacterium]
MSIDDIRSYIQDELLNDATTSIGDDDDLLLSETLDSLRVMRLVQHVEDRTGLSVPPEDVTIENFRSLRHIHAYLSSRRTS